MKRHVIRADELQVGDVFPTPSTVRAVSQLGTVVTVIFFDDRLGRSASMQLVDRDLVGVERA